MVCCVQTSKHQYESSVTQPSFKSIRVDFCQRAVEHFDGALVSAVPDLFSICPNPAIGLVPAESMFREPFINVRRGVTGWTPPRLCWSSLIISIVPSRELNPTNRQRIRCSVQSNRHSNQFGMVKFKRWFLSDSFNLRISFGKILAVEIRPRYIT